MANQLMTDLEAILQDNQFVLLDTSAIIGYTSNLMKEFFKQLYGEPTPYRPETIPLEIIARDKKIKESLKTSNAFVTKHVLNEYKRGINVQDRKINQLTYNHNSQTNPQKEQQKNYWEQMKTEMRQIAELLKTKKTHFSQKDAYKQLFKFFEHIAPYTKTEEKKKYEKTRRLTYLFEDESICAATMYYTLTAEKGCPTIVVSQDNDIRKSLQLAHLLFREAMPGEFDERLSRTPYTLYFPIKMNGEKRYEPVKKTAPEIIWSIIDTKEKHAKALISDLTIYAREVLKTVCTT